MFEDLKKDDQWEETLANPNIDVLNILDKISNALEKFSLDIINTNVYSNE